MLLSLSGFLFEDNYNSQSITFAEFCSIGKAAGYSGVELRLTQVNPDTPGPERKAILRIADNAGLKITCLTARGMPSSGTARDDFFKRYLELCGDMKCALLKTGGDPTWLRQAAEEAKGYGVTLAGNNHIGGQLETVEGTLQYFSQIAHPNFCLLYDSMHLHISGEDYLGCIPEFIGITRNILVQSRRPTRSGEEASINKNGNPWTRALPDESGVQNWSRIFSTFRRLGYDDLVTVIESGWPGDQREFVANHCARIVRQFWEENAGIEKTQSD